jgi:hypothetical protein
MYRLASQLGAVLARGTVFTHSWRIEMTLQELIDELAAATDGAAEDGSFRQQHPLFPSITTTRVTYMKRDTRSIELSQQMVYVENLGTKDEAAYYEKSRVPSVVLEAAYVPPTPNATPDEIKANIDTLFPDTKFWDIQIQSGTEAGTLTGMFYDGTALEAEHRAYRVVKDDKDVFTAFRIKG